jgi:hypothetical protein
MFEELLVIFRQGTSNALERLLVSLAFDVSSAYDILESLPLGSVSVAITEAALNDV